MKKTKTNTLTPSFIMAQHDITNENKIEKHLQPISKLNKQKTCRNIMDSERQVSKLNMWYWLYAIGVIILAALAIMALLYIIFLLNKDNGLRVNTTNSAASNIGIGTDKATLTLEDGSGIILEKGTTFQTPHIRCNDTAIVYRAGVIQPTPSAFNYLSIPSGDSLYVKLSDGTAFWLNSVSKIPSSILQWDIPPSGASRRPLK